MGDERDIYCDGKHLSDLSYNWESACGVLFSDDDLFVRPPVKAHAEVRKTATGWHDEPILRYLYAPTEKVRRRLNIQGFTNQKCRELWEREFANHIARLEQMRSMGGEDFGAQIDLQKGLNYEQFEALFENQAEADPKSLLRWSGLHLFSVNDAYADLALHIDTRKPKAIWIDLTTLYPDEYDSNLPLHANLENVPANVDLIETIGNVLILTEGTSDTRILSTAIQAMYPEYADMFEFVDFGEFKVEGGASPLTKMVKAFAGVRMSQRIIALFDNDAAGLEQFTFLKKAKLPASIKPMTLPQSTIGRRYPTLGPEGLRTMDINGAACSIEMFLGREALSDSDGRLRPVRWSSWNPKVSRYQGEMEGKGAATDAFIGALQAPATPAARRRRFKEMDALLQLIFRAWE